MPVPVEQPKPDDEICAVLEHARELASTREPLYEWDDLCEIIQSCRLGELNRHPDLEALYAGTFNPLLKRHYGTTEAYLRRQLGWPAEEARDEAQDADEYWTRGATTNVRRNDWPYAVPKGVQHWVVWVPLPLFHPLLCKSPKPRAAGPNSSSSSSNAPSGAATPSGFSNTNPFAKAPGSTSLEQPLRNPTGLRPPPAGHLSPSDAFARDVDASSRRSGSLDTSAQSDPVAPTKGTWDWVSRNGLGGLTGQAAERYRARYGVVHRRDGTPTVLEADLRDDSIAGRGVAESGDGGEYRDEEGPEREIRAFVEKKWPVRDGWETAWFANPPGLQSVPGLAHFHVLACKS